MRKSRISLGAAGGLAILPGNDTNTSKEQGSFLEILAGILKLLPLGFHVNSVGGRHYQHNAIKFCPGSANY